MPHEAIMVMPVPGAFQAAAGGDGAPQTRRYACIVALGYVIRGWNASLRPDRARVGEWSQLAAIETGVPVAFEVLTWKPRAGRGADRRRPTLSAAQVEMADVFSQLRAQAAGLLH